jgi:hypothetical protein
MREPNCPRHKDAHYTGGAEGVNAGAEPAASAEYIYVSISYPSVWCAPRLHVVNRRHCRRPVWRQAWAGNSERIQCHQSALRLRSRKSCGRVGDPVRSGRHSRDSRRRTVTPRLPRWRGAGAVDRGGLENRCTLYWVPRVRIPPSPPDLKILI